jgi:hypothetical protein
MNTEMIGMPGAFEASMLLLFARHGFAGTDPTYLRRAPAAMPGLSDNPNARTKDAVRRCGLA